MRERNDRIDEFGNEVPDSTPVTLPVGFSRPLTIQEMIQRAVRTTISQAAAEQGDETWEEADDFDTGEDNELRSPYELDDEVHGGSVREFIEEQVIEKPKKPEEPMPARPEEPMPARVAKPTPHHPKGKPRAKAPAAPPEPLEPDEGD